MRKSKKISFEAGNKSRKLDEFYAFDENDYLVQIKNKENKKNEQTGK